MCGKDVVPTRFLYHQPTGPRPVTPKKIGQVEKLIGKVKKMDEDGEFANQVEVEEGITPWKHRLDEDAQVEDEEDI